jgi:hypothetical protein
MKIATMSFPIVLGRAVAMGAPTALHGVRITASVRKMMAQLHISEAEWIASARRRARGGDALSDTPLGRKSIERSVEGERQVGMPTGFRNV